MPKDKRTAGAEAPAKDAEAQIKPEWDEIVETMPPDVQAERAKLREQLHEVEATAPDPLRRTPTRSSTRAKPRRRATCCGWAIRTASSIPVEPAVPLRVQGGLRDSDGIRRAPDAPSRIGWPRADNPLTARVMANRIWQFRMGDGLVRTPNDFGVMGDKPEQSRAARLAGRGVRGARLERQGDGPADRDLERLPAIVWRRTLRRRRSIRRIGSFWRMNRKRFDAEMIRDAALSRCRARSIRRLGGRPVRIPIEPEVYDLIFTEHERDGLWPVNPDRTCRIAAASISTTSAACGCRCSPLSTSPTPSPPALCVRCRRTRCRRSRCSTRASCRMSRTTSRRVWRSHAAQDQGVPDRHRMASRSGPRRRARRREAGARVFPDPAARCRISVWRCSTAMSFSMSHEPAYSRRR